MSLFQSFRFSLGKLGYLGTIRLLMEKRAKKKRLLALLKTKGSFAELILPKRTLPDITEKDNSTMIERADEMMNDENYFFTFIYHLKGITDPWNYDPIEKKYWPKKNYEETKVHSADTPRDVKIIWEINRFKYLPLLAEAAAITKDKKYSDECESRMISWIEANPFAASINWSSPLEIAIRGISWAASLRILALAGFDISRNKKIAQSIWQHAAYLNAELSTDKIVRSNHLIGETVGLYILSSLFNFPEAVFFKLRAKKLLTDSILKQTYSDGVSKEASGWYHTFVADFADLVLRVASETGDSFDNEFTDRYCQMSIYHNSIMLPDGDPVRFGDCDFGKAINLSKKWKDAILGTNTLASSEKNCFFEKAQHLTFRLGENFMFARAGEFGWGGDGFSSHAHDDFLSPIVALDKVNLLVDPGTYEYNGAPEQRDKERNAHSHNGLIIGGETGAVLKPSFGWLKTRPAAIIDSFSWAEDKIMAEASYGEWRGQHSRHFTLTKEEFILEDHFQLNADQTVEWNFHFHPRWRLEKLSPSKFALHDFRDYHFEFELSGMEAELEVLKYEFAPAYMQKSNAWMLRMQSIIHKGEKQRVRFNLRKQ